MKPSGPKVDPSGGCFVRYILALSVRKHIFLKIQKADPEHCENWRHESGSEFHKTSPMCERGEWRKQLRDFIMITQSSKQLPHGSSTARPVEDETENDDLRWGLLFLERTRILSGIQFTTHFVEIFVVKTKRFVGSFLYVILTRQTCGQRSSKAAESKRRALGNYFFERICNTFLISKCRGD